MKKVFYAIIFLITLYFVLSFFGPGEIKVERSVVINAPPQVIREKLGDFEFFHEKWSPWTDKDPHMKSVYTGIPGQPGHHYSWSGDHNVGSGELMLERFNGDSLIQSFSRNGHESSIVYFLIEEQSAGQTLVTWGRITEIGFLERAPVLFVDPADLYGGNNAKALMRLKKVIEDEERFSDENALQ